MSDRPSSMRAFFTIWIGQAFSLFGSQIVQFAIAWWLTTRTGSGTVLATATFVAMLPSVIMGPLAGAYVDRWNRKRVMLVADSAVALLSLCLALLARFDLLRVGYIYAVMLGRGIGGAFHWPAMRASMSLMVPEKHLTRVNSLNQALDGVLTIIAPPAGALLLSILPLHTLILIDVLTALMAIIPLLLTAVPQPSDRPTTQATSIWTDVRQGIHYVWSWRGLRMMLMMATVINFLLGPAFSLLPLLVREHFGGEAWLLGEMESLWGIGIIAGSLILSVWGGFQRRIYTALLGLVGMGSGLLFVGAAPGHRPIIALAGLAFAGMMNAITNGPLFAILQAVVPPSIQGRVFTVIQSLSAAMTPLGLLIAGPVGDWLGAQIWYLLGGIACLLIGIGALFIPDVIYLEDQRAPVPASDLAAS